MKRIIAIIIAATLICLSLVACGKPSDVSQEMYDIGIAALQVADDYMAYKIDGTTANDKIATLYDDANTIYERNKETEYHRGDYKVSSSIQFLKWEISLSTLSNGVPGDIKEDRD